MVLLISRIGQHQVNTNAGSISSRLSAVQVADKLFTSFGQDILDALFWTATEPRSRRREHVGVLPHLLLAIVYVCILVLLLVCVFVPLLAILCVYTMIFIHTKRSTNYV